MERFYGPLDNLQSLDSCSKLSDNACELRKRVATCRTNDIYLGIVSPFVADIFKGKMSILDGIRSAGNEYLDFSLLLCHCGGVGRSFCGRNVMRSFAADHQ